MTEETDGRQTPAAGLAGVARFIAGLAILFVAGLAILLVLDLISLEMFGSFATRVILVLCIVGLASAAIALLVGSGKSPRR